MRDLVIVGAGGFGREVADAVDAVNATAPTFRLLGFVDDAPSQEDLERVDRLGSTLLGGVADLEAMHQVEYVIGIGSGRLREAIDTRLSAAGLRPSILVHPSATVGADAYLGAGTVICAGARITTNVSLGRHVHVNLGSTIGHDTDLADYVTVNPLVAVSGNVVIGTQTMLGPHSSILQGLRIGARATVGAAACVVKDVPDDTLVKGVPAR